LKKRTKLLESAFAAFINVIINHADKGTVRIGFSFYVAQQKPVTILRLPFALVCIIYVCLPTYAQQSELAKTGQNIQVCATSKQFLSYLCPSMDLIAISAQSQKYCKIYSALPTMFVQFSIRNSINFTALTNFEFLPTLYESFPHLFQSVGLQNVFMVISVNKMRHSSNWGLWHFIKICTW